MRRWGPKEWARPIARIAADGAADLVDHAVARAFGQCRSSNYLRIQVSQFLHLIPVSCLVITLFVPTLLNKLGA
jgi:hypothetical protein